VSWCARDWAAEQWTRTHLSEDVRFKWSKRSKRIQISHLAGKTLFRLADHESNDEKRRCDPSVGRLAELTGASPRAVNKAIDQLEAAGLIRVKRRPKKGGKWDTNLYTLLIPEAWRDDWERDVKARRTRGKTPYTAVSAEGLEVSIERGGLPADTAPEATERLHNNYLTTDSSYGIPASGADTAGSQYDPFTDIPGVPSKRMPSIEKERA